MEKVRLGIIGMGNMGNGHLRSILNGECPRIEVTALADTDPEKLKKAGEMCKDAMLFETSEALMDSGLADAVLIAAIEEAGGGIDQLGVCNNNNVFFVEFLTTVDLYAVDKHPVGALLIHDHTASAVLNDPRVMLGDADMGKYDIAVLTASNQILLLLREGDPPPLVFGRGARYQKKHAIGNTFSSIVDPDQVSVAQFSGIYGRIIENQAIGARLVSVNRPILNKPLTAPPDKTAMRHGDKRRMQDNVILRTASEVQRLPLAVQRKNDGTLPPVKYGNGRCVCHVVLRNDFFYIYGFFAVIHSVPTLP